MTVKRVQLIQKNVDLLISQITDKQLKQAAESVKTELQSILASETEGTGQLAQSIQVQRGTQRGKPIIRILSAPHGRPFFQGTKAPYAGFPPSSENGADERFQFWANAHSFRPRRLSRIIALGKSRGQVYTDRTNILIRAIRTGFRNLRS